MMRAMCVLASYERLQNADEASLLPSYVPARGLERMATTYDALSDSDPDGDGDPHTASTLDLQKRDEAMLPDLDDSCARCGIAPARCACQTIASFASPGSPGPAATCGSRASRSSSGHRVRTYRRRRSRSAGCAPALWHHFAMARWLAAVIVVAAAGTANAQVFKPRAGKPSSGICQGAAAVGDDGEDGCSGGGDGDAADIADSDACAGRGSCRCDDETRGVADTVDVDEARVAGRGERCDAGEEAEEEHAAASDDGGEEVIVVDDDDAPKKPAPVKKPKPKKHDDDDVTVTDDE